MASGISFSLSNIIDTTFEEEVEFSVGIICVVDPIASYKGFAFGENSLIGLRSGEYGGK
jgi:hypothetical protein